MKLKVQTRDTFRLKPALSQQSTVVLGLHSPLLPPNEKPLLLKDHVLERHPDKQGCWSYISNRGGHDQPVGCATVTRWLCQIFDFGHNDCKSLHDDEEWYTQAYKLKHLTYGKLQRLPCTHPVELRETEAVVPSPASPRAVRPRTGVLFASTSIFHTPLT